MCLGAFFLTGCARVVEAIPLAVGEMELAARCGKSYGQSAADARGGARDEDRPIIHDRKITRHGASHQMQRPWWRDGHDESETGSADAAP